MTTCTLRFAVAPEKLEHDVSLYMTPEIGPTWPVEPHQVTLLDLKSELAVEGEATPIMKQLDSRGFAILKNRSVSLGHLKEQEIWNPAYLEETSQMIKDQLGAAKVFVWNSVTRSSDPSLNTAYGDNHFQKSSISGLQFGGTIRPTASGAHVDQDTANSRRMCKAAAGEEAFETYSRVQQLNVWRPLKGPVTLKPLAVCDGSTVSETSRVTHCGLFGTRVMLHYEDSQKWYYIKRQEPDECIVIKIYDSTVLPGQADYSPHTGVDDLGGVDGPEVPRESIEVRVVVCFA